MTDQEQSKQLGFSTIELLIVVTMIGILATLAVPSYREFQQRAQRSEAVQVLLGFAACQAQQRAKIGMYDTTACRTAITSNHYEYSVSPYEVSRTFEFKYTAKPRDKIVHNRCGSLSIDHLGRRGISGAEEFLSECWGGR